MTKAQLKAFVESLRKALHIERVYKRRREGSRDDVLREFVIARDIAHNLEGSQLVRESLVRITERIQVYEQHENYDEEEAEIVMKLQGTMTQCKRNTGFHDVCGLEAAKAALREAIIYPLQYPEYFTSKILSPIQSILLHGSSGCGKTLLVQSLCGEVEKQCSVECKLYSISGASLLSKWTGESEKSLKCLFKVAKRSSPAIIFFDEIDAIACTRTSDMDVNSRRILTEFLVQMSSLHRHDRVTIIAATNRPYDLDEAVVRRFQAQVCVPIPNSQIRQSMIQHYLAELDWNLNTEDWEKILSHTTGFSGSDLARVCKEAAMIPVRECIVMNTRVPPRTIVLGDFTQAWAVCKSTVTTIAQWKIV